VNGATWIVVGLIGAVLVFIVVVFNRLVTLRQLVRNAWSNIDTELKRRHDLIPRLVEVVKGYAAHERGVFERVADARASAVAGEGVAAGAADRENELARATRGLLAVAEGYPDLKSGDHFLELQRELIETEDRIQAARRFYNGNVKDLNTLIEQFPSMLVAQAGGFGRVEPFEVEAAVEREAVAVRF